MRNGAWLLVISMSVYGCGGAPLFPLASTYPWKCVMRDAKGDLFVGMDEDRQIAIAEAHRQCFAGSSLRHGCKVENSYCEQLPGRR